MNLRVLILPAKRDAEPVGRDTLDFEVEIAPESPYMAQGRTIPSGRQRRSHLKRSESRRTNAEQSFGKNTAVEAALGRKLPHRTGAFGPCLDKIGDMIARKAPSCKPMQNRPPYRHSLPGKYPAGHRASSDPRKPSRPVPSAGRPPYGVRGRAARQPSPHDVRKDRRRGACRSRRAVYR